MVDNVKDTAKKMLSESPINDYQIAKGTGIHASTISNYRKGRLPSRPNATLIIDFLEKQHNTSNLTNELTDPTKFINPLISSDMNPNLALDFIDYLKRENASLKEQLEKTTSELLDAKDVLIQHLNSKNSGGGI